MLVVALNLAGWIQQSSSIPCDILLLPFVWQSVTRLLIIPHCVPSIPVILWHPCLGYVLFTNNITINVNVTDRWYCYPYFVRTLLNLRHYKPYIGQRQVWRLKWPTYSMVFMPYSFWVSFKYLSNQVPLKLTLNPIS